MVRWWRNRYTHSDDELQNGSGVRPDNRSTTPESVILSMRSS
jgi:hypothetical protein